MSDPLLALHTGVFRDTDLLGDVALARGAGYGAVELQLDKLIRHADADPDAEALRSALGPLTVPMTNALLGIERLDSAHLGAIRRAAPLLAAVECGVLQVVALDGFGAAGGSAAARHGRLVAALDPLVEAAGRAGLRLGLEPVSFSPFHKLDEALEIVTYFGPARIGLVLDTWHLWTSGTAWRDVAALDPAAIARAHLGDGAARTGAAWSDEDRAALPGAGVVPVVEGIRAIAATGYSGGWGVEAHGRAFADAPALALATDLHRAATAALAQALRA